MQSLIKGTRKKEKMPELNIWDKRKIKIPNTIKSIQLLN